MLGVERERERETVRVWDELFDRENERPCSLFDLSLFLSSDSTYAALHMMMGKGLVLRLRMWPTRDYYLVTFLLLAVVALLQVYACACKESESQREENNAEGRT